MYSPPSLYFSPECSILLYRNAKRQLKFHHSVPNTCVCPRNCLLYLAEDTDNCLPLQRPPPQPRLPKTPTEIEEKKFMRRHFSSPRQIVDEMSCRDPAATGQRHRCHRMEAKYRKIIKRLSKSMEVWISLVLNYFFFHPQSGNDK